MSEKTGIKDHIWVPKWLPLLKSGYRGLENGYRLFENGYRVLENGYRDSENGYQCFLWFRKWLLVVFVVPKMVISGFLWFRTGFRWFRRGRKWFLRLRHGYRRFQNGYRVFKTGYREHENYENHFGTKNVVRYFCIAVYTARYTKN